MAGSFFLLAAALSQLCHGVMCAPAPEQQPLSLHDTAPSPVPVTPEKIEARKLHGRFLHISDFHPDEFYKVHASTSADRACHRGKGPAGTYGAETSDCDSPISLVNATFDWVISSGLRDDIDFVIWTGDNARHDSDENIPRSAAQVIGTNRLLADKFAETFSDAKGMRVPVVPTFGNNDILPHNVLMPGPNKWLARYADIWRKFIPEEQHHSFEFGGWFYVEVIPNQLAVFSLNTLYFFDRNAAIDDCTKPSEPGFKHMEWLRVQLQYMRERGMKAILMGHVPPARTDSKVLWEESCWQKYTLWLQQYRDVVISSLYGHMNIDHFMLLDTKEIDITSAGVTSEEGATVREHLDDELSIQSATDYLEEVRDGWAKLPKPELYSDDEATSGKGKKKKGKGKKDKNKKLGGKWAERYHLAFVSPSIVPNYFPTLRVFDYNITGLENAVTWADYTDLTKQPPTIGGSEVDLEETMTPELELRDLSDDELPDVEAEKRSNNIKKDKHKKKGKKKNKKNKKGKGKKPGKGKDPNLVVPNPPAKSAPPGPAYSPQPLTLTGYTQYFANLTHINNDMTGQFDDLETEKWREGKHGDKKPKSKPRPHKFKFEVEYTTYEDKLYNLTDLTVRSFVDLAYRMGQTANGKSDELALPSGDSAIDLDDIEAEDLESEELELQDIHVLEDEDDINESDEDGSVEAEKKKKGKKGKKDKKKKKKKKTRKSNKTWLHFLKHAFVSTVDDDDLKGESA
ncbi:Endopolyphosphatase [Cytospora mali]|uniref:Endopolyphosphatase n=1 Tax=Cytospora mali TaxID=578113 RepID=A0A194VPV8_CYTMA|nr:Endopolyphosphatase [Valsa mali]